MRAGRARPRALTKKLKTASVGVDCGLYRPQQRHPIPKIR
jgi:hypothetical protein